MISEERSVGKASLFNVGRLSVSIPALLAFTTVAALAAAQGGYFPTAWGWAGTALLWATALALTLRTEVRLSAAEWFFGTGLLAFVAWIALSSAWSVAPAETVLEIERALVYAAGVFAVLLIARASSAGELLGALLGAISIICIFSLATRVLPDRVGVYDPTAVYRLAQPIGYWNGLALFAAMGILLAFGFAAQ
jgi:hypothetical protein